MSNSLHPLDLLIRQTLDNNPAKPAGHSIQSHPLYVSREEVDNLVNNAPDKTPNVSNEYLAKLEVLTKLFSLNEFEKNALLIILAPEIDSKYERIYAYFQNDLTRKYPTVALISLLLFGSENEPAKFLPYFLPQFPLQKFALIQCIDATKELGAISQPLKIEASVRNFILGCHTLDKGMSAYCKLLSPDKNNENHQGKSDLIRGITRGIREKKRFLVHLYGPEQVEKQTMALELASVHGYGLLVVNTTLAIQDSQPLESVLRRLFRESILSGTLIYFDQFDAVYENEKHGFYESLLFDFLDEYSWLTFCSSAKQWKPKSLTQTNLFVTAGFDRPGYKKATSIWATNLKKIGGETSRELPDELAKLFRFTGGEISRITRILSGHKFTGRVIDKKIVYDVCREQISAGLNNLAQNLKHAYSLDDIVLLEEQKQQLKNIIASYRHQHTVFEHWGFKKTFQSAGISALFTGPPGTGKTMSASIMANELELDLYRIDLSRVVSKYIGETEKNLAKIFEAAEGAGVMLFFDEADALFGKRTEVKDAHDRFANIEISYLLQRIEEYNGPVVLASNFRRNIDEAFIRRIHFILEFPFPDEAMREKIWRKVFPKQAPLNNSIDFKFLAKNFKLSGASIRNIALSAAFFSAEDTQKIHMKHVVQGVKSELQKIGKTYQPADFGPYGM